jgi:signal transduction histidine kinase
MLGVSVLLSWTILLTFPGMGLVPVLVVMTAALSVYVVPLWMSGLLVVANSAVLAIMAVLYEVPLLESTTVVGFYFLIQAATVLSTATMRREMRLRDELTEAHIELRAASVLLSESTRTSERLRISRELHDLIGHQLTVLTLELEAAKHRPGERAVEHIERADGIARSLLADVRMTVGELRHSGSADLADALRSVADGIPDLEVGIDVDPDVQLHSPQQAAFVRGVQEIVTNTLRHAEGSHLRITVTHEGDMIVLHAVDNGVGQRSPVPGNGLSGLRERFVELDGDLTIDGNDGFRVTARVPTT